MHREWRHFWFDFSQACLLLNDGRIVVKVVTDFFFKDWFELWSNNERSAGISFANVLHPYVSDARVPVKFSLCNLTVECSHKVWWSAYDYTRSMFGLKIPLGLQDSPDRYPKIANRSSDNYSRNYYLDLFNRTSGSPTPAS